VSYAVSDAGQGSVARNRTWQVAGFRGAFGVNLDPVIGGAGAFGHPELRREARRRSREDHPLVSSADIVAAAKSLPLLEVARAWVIPSDERTPRTGVVTLVAMRSRPSGTEPGTVPETRRWLEAIRRRLVGRMPLGARLVVAAPGYVGFTIRAAIETTLGRDPTAVKKSILEALRSRLALVATAKGGEARKAGVPVTARDVKAWLRQVDGVSRIVELKLVRADGRRDADITVPRSGLPKWDEAASDIVVSRLGTDRAP
jgi:predicted phage baseplate assembly protein